MLLAFPTDCRRLKFGPVPISFVPHFHCGDHGRKCEQCRYRIIVRLLYILLTNNNQYAWTDPSIRRARVCCSTRPSVCQSSVHRRRLLASRGRPVFPKRAFSGPAWNVQCDQFWMRDRERCRPMRMAGLLMPHRVCVSFLRKTTINNLTI